MMMRVDLYSGFDFKLLEQPDFKEDAVREELISPLLYNLGYSASGLNQIIRSKTLQHPFVSVGSGQRKINIVPDYLLTVDNKPAWVLDAKAPFEKIESGQHVEQTYFYAIHPEIRTQIFALCNGREFIAFYTGQAQPVLYFQMSEIEKHWEKLYNLLAPNAFKTQPVVPVQSGVKSEQFNYNNITPPVKLRI